MDWIFRLIVALLFVLVGGGIAFAAVRTWFSGEPYLPGPNAMAIAVGIVLLVVGLVILAL